jgi:DNA helicase-2/ATP-dependent DNA helicase PcrA
VPPDPHLPCHPDVLKEYHKRFKYILVDEYQDTNTAQYLWLRLLAQETGGPGQKNVCCVGDDDQSIYGWRGAEVDNILRFDKDFPAPRSSGWSATTARPAISSVPPPI